MRKYSGSKIRLTQPVALMNTAVNMAVNAGVNAAVNSQAAYQLIDSARSERIGSFLLVNQGCQHDDRDQDGRCQKSGLISVIAPWLHQHRRKQNLEANHRNEEA
jgi:hypothetical protein